MAKKVLLLTYYFHPCTYVAANRPNSFAKELHRYGFEVTVVTRHWTGQERLWQDMISTNLSPVTVEDRNGVQVHRLPFKSFAYNSSGIASKINTLNHHFKGNLHPELDYYQLKPYVEELMTKEPFDFIMVSVPPLNILKLGFELKKKFKVPLLVDVRDFQNHVLLHKSPELSLLEKIKYKLAIRHSIKWFAAADLVFTITPLTTSFIKKQSGVPVITLMNGFEEHLLQVNERQHDQFYITLVGSVYENEDFTELLRACQQLFTHDFASEIIFQFIGSVTTESVRQKIERAIPAKNLILKERMAQVLAQKEAARSQLLLVQGFTHMRGVLGTKPFEYMGLRKTIIQMPGDRDMMEQIIRDCKAGYCPHSPAEFVAHVRDCYQQWKEQGHLSYKGDVEKIKRYSREEQFKMLLPYIT